MESIQTNALNSKYINSLLRPEENPFMQEMQSFEEIMMMYSCAIREVKTKFEVLNDDFSVRYKRNPIVKDQKACQHCQKACKQGLSGYMCKYTEQSG